MKPWTQVLSHSVRALLDAAFSLLLWTFWLALVLLLALQLYILTASELTLPDFALRRIESKLAESGLRATFRRTSFDPTGRVLVDDARLFLPAFSEPVLTAHAIYVQFNPLALVVGKIEPSEVRVLEAAVTIPAALSQSGQPEEIIRGVDAVIEPARAEVAVRQLNGDVGGIMVAAHGTVPVRRGSEQPDAAALKEFFTTRFPALCRQASAATRYARQVDAPTLQLELSASESGALIINVTALARAVRLEQPFAAKASGLQITTRLLLFGDRVPSDFAITADDLELPMEARAHAVHARVLGQFRPNSFQFDWREVTATADTLTAAGVTTNNTSVLAFPRLLPQLQAVVVTRLLDEPLALRTEADLGDKSALVHFRGALSPAVLELISQRVGVDVRKFYSYEALTVDAADARFGAGWKFEKLTARVRVPRMNSYGVTMEDGRAAVELDPERFYAPEAFARIGANFAHGSYEHLFGTHQYRFLLDGRLRPLEISPWFHEWWPDFFRQLEFVDAPPLASVEVAGFWRESHRTSVFVFADAGKSVVRGTPFDRVRTRMFIRPAFYDGLEILAQRGEADVHGRFTLISDPRTHDWQTLDLGLDSTFDLKTAAQLLGEAGAKALEPFKLASPPLLKVRGNFAGPAAPKGAKDKLQIAARSTGEFRFHDFPLHDTRFVATLDGDDIVLEEIAATFAGGAATGHARVWGEDKDRRLGFDVALRDATLGEVAAQLEEYFSAQKGVPPAAPGKFVKAKANVKVDFAASAEGRYSDPLSFRGDGSAALHGAEIGEVPLLGTLSELLKFTALRFTEARANFKIEGTKVVFQQFDLRGSNSAIDAHGEFALDKRTLDFKAKIFPFHESESVLKSVVGAVLTPLSNAFEVKLTGSLEKPEWAFVMGPTNLLRSLGEGGEHAKADSPPVAAPAAGATAGKP